MRILWLVIVLFSVSVKAAPVSIDLRGSSVAEFVELVFKHTLRRDYVLGPGVASPEPKITVSVAGMERDDVLKFAGTVLQGYGFSLDDSGPVLRINRSSNQGQELSRQGPLPGVAVSAGAGLEVPGTVVDGHGPKKQDEAPEQVEVYFPKYRTVESLLEAVKLTGVKTSPAKNAAALVYSGNVQRVAVAGQLLQQLDKRAGVVDVRAVIVEYSDTSESQQSFSAVLQLLEGKMGINLAAGIAGANSVKLAGKSISAVLTALEGDSRFKQLAEPRLRVVDGSKARVLVGADFPVRGQSTTDKTGNAVASIEYKQAGIILELTPQILETSILMAVHQQVSSVALTTSSGIDSPSVNKREVQTVVDMQSGEVVMLAGLDNSTEIDTSAGFSWLPSFMAGKNRAKGRTQIFLLLEVNRAKQSEI